MEGGEGGGGLISDAEASCQTDQTRCARDTPGEGGGVCVCAERLTWQGTNASIPACRAIRRQLHAIEASRFAKGGRPQGRVEPSAPSGVSDRCRCD